MWEIPWYWDTSAAKCPAVETKEEDKCTASRILPTQHCISFRYSLVVLLEAIKACIKSKEFTRIVQFFSTYNPICDEMLILSDKVVHVWISSRKPLVCQNPRIALGLAKARPLGHANVQGQTRHSNVLQLPGSKGRSWNWLKRYHGYLSIVIIFSGITYESQL